MSSCNSLKDDYSHINGDLFYIVENIPGPLCEEDVDSLNINKEYNSQLSLHCKCVDDCVEYICECLLKKEQNYKRINETELIITDACLERDKLIFECNPMCSCSELKCSNHLIQFGPRDGLEIKQSVLLENSEKTNTALGLFTKCAINKGSFICEYAGELLSKLEATNRSKFNDKNNLMNYIICLNEFTKEHNNQTFIDPSKFGNIGRYMNHSCDPNCSMLPIRTGSPIPKLCLFANRDIKADTELTFSYGFDYDTNMTSNRIECLCQSPNCRKWLPNIGFK